MNTLLTNHLRIQWVERDYYNYTVVCVQVVGQWPSHKVSYDVGDENQRAWLVQRYCSSCFSKWKSRK
jgi:hypothetical protein